MLLNVSALRMTSARLSCHNLDEWLQASDAWTLRRRCESSASKILTTSPCPQAKWAMESLMNRGEAGKDEGVRASFDASKVAEQAAWARERLQAGGGDSPAAPQREPPLPPLAEAEIEAQGGSPPPPAIISPTALAPSPPANSPPCSNTAVAAARRSVTPQGKGGDDDVPLPPPRRRSLSPSVNGLDESSASLPPLQAETRSPQTIHDLTAEESFFAELQDGLTEDERARVMMLRSPQ